MAAGHSGPPGLGHTGWQAAGALARATAKLLPVLVLSLRGAPRGLGHPGGPGSLSEGRVGTRTGPSLLGTGVNSRTLDAGRMGRLSRAEEGPGGAREASPRVGTASSCFKASLQQEPALARRFRSHFHVRVKGL